MGQLKHAEMDKEFESFLQELIDGGHLEGATLGISKLVIDKGEAALRTKQQFVFDRQVKDEFTTKECSFCGEDIPWCEMYAADDSGTCGWCAHQDAKGNR